MQNNSNILRNSYDPPTELPATCSASYQQETTWTSESSSQPVDSWKSPQPEESWRSAPPSVRNDESWVQRAPDTKPEPSVSDEFTRHSNAKRSHDGELVSRNGHSANNGHETESTVLGVSAAKNPRRLQCFQEISKDESWKTEIKEEEEDFEEKVRKQLEMMKKMENQNVHHGNNEYEQDEYEEVEDEPESEKQIESPANIPTPTTAAKLPSSKIIARDVNFEQIHFFNKNKRPNTSAHPHPMTTQSFVPLKDESWLKQYERRINSMKQAFNSNPVSTPPTRNHSSFFFAPAPISHMKSNRYPPVFNGPATNYPVPGSSYPVPVPSYPVPGPAYPVPGPAYPVPGPAYAGSVASPPFMPIPQPVPVPARLPVQESLPPPGLVSESYFKGDESKKSGLLGTMPGGKTTKASSYNGPVGWQGMPISQSVPTTRPDAQKQVEVDSDDEDDDDTYRRLLGMFKKEEKL